MAERGDGQLGAMPSLANLGSLASSFAESALAPTASADAIALQPPAKKRVPDHFFHGVGISPVPGRLVQRIKDGVFVDMAKLLPDNLELLRREAVNPFQAKDSKLKLRQISSISAWVQCFATFIAIRSQSAPEKVSDMLAYMRLLVREAARHGGTGWLAYDSFFRQQAAADPSLRWDSLNADLFNLTVLDAALCRLCLGTDHRTSDCALAQSRDQKTLLALQLVDDPKPKSKLLPRLEKEMPICRSFNSFSQPGCRVQNCRFRHVCTVCLKQHKVLECPNRKPPNVVQAAQAALAARAV